MAVTVDDLIAPIGELSAEMFPDMNLNVAAGAWLEQALAATATVDATVADRAIKHWVYSRAYRTIARRLALQPNSASAEEISESIGADRIRYFDRLADLNEGLYLELTIVPAVQQTDTGTRSVPTKVAW